MENNLIDIIRELYPGDKKIPTLVELDGDTLKIIIGDEVRFYKFNDNRLYVYKPIEVLGEAVNKFKKIFREAKINTILT